MRVKKRVKRGVKKGIKRVKSAPPEAYVAGTGVLVGGAAMVLLATTKSGRELLIRTVQLGLRPQPEADEQESQESDVQEEVHREPAEDADVEEKPEEDTNGDGKAEVTGAEEKPEEDTNGDGKAEVTGAEEKPEEDSNGHDESEVTDLKPRIQRPRSPRKATAPRKAADA
jgi:hypothetical protein